MTFQSFKSPHTLVELLAYKQIGIRSEVNPKIANLLSHLQSPSVGLE